MSKNIEKKLDPNLVKTIKKEPSLFTSVADLIEGSKFDSLQAVAFMDLNVLKKSSYELNLESIKKSKGLEKKV